MKTKTFNNLTQVLQLIGDIESMAVSVEMMAGKKDEKARDFCQSAAQTILSDVKKLRKRTLGLV